MKAFLKGMVKGSGKAGVAFRATTLAVSAFTSVLTQAYCKKAGGQLAGEFLNYAKRVDKAFKKK